MTEHDLKTWPKPFQLVWRGEKLYELRRNDRKFQVGDGVFLHEWTPVHEERCQWYSPFDGQQTSADDIRCRLCDRRRKQPLAGEYTGRWIKAQISCITLHGDFPGLEEDFVILGIRLTDRSRYSPG